MKPSSDARAGEWQPDVMCDGNGECFRLEAQVEHLKAEIQKVADDLTAENEQAHEQINALTAKLAAIEKENEELLARVVVPK